jgi:hypothetical protein
MGTNTSKVCKSVSLSRNFRNFFFDIVLSFDHSYYQNTIYIF